MSAKTTADLFRDRGWGVGTKVQLDGDDGGPIEVTYVGRQIVAAIGSDGFESIWRTTTDGWSLYTLTPPIPTREEWAELWAKLEAWRESVIAAVAVTPMQNLVHAIDAIAAKVEP
jgi:hypothetical protein